jgi:hypothetical protein
VSGSHSAKYENNFWDMAPCSLVEKLTNVSDVVTASIVAIMEVVSNSETSVSYEIKRRNISEDSRFHSTKKPAKIENPVFNYECNI